MFSQNAACMWNMGKAQVKLCVFRSRIYWVADPGESPSNDTPQYYAVL